MTRLSTWFLAFVVTVLGSSLAQADEFYVACWNVENLFDLEDDPAVELDEEFTPDGRYAWTAQRLERKLKNLAGVIKKMNRGRGPDVLGLCEVENRQVVEMLLDRLAPLGRKYEVVHQDSPSDRGIDCALLFDANEFGLADAKFHFVDADKTRDIVEARLRRAGGDLFVFVNHWPSRGNDEWQRIEAAAVLRQRIDEILAADPKADMLMIGDFNDEPDNVSLKDHLRAHSSRNGSSPSALFNSTAALRAAGKGSIVWDQQWQLIDQIILSPGMLDDAGFRWKADSSQLVDFPELLLPAEAGMIARPARTYSYGSYQPEGSSDHLPVGCVIVQ